MNHAFQIRGPAETVIGLGEYRHPLRPCGGRVEFLALTQRHDRVPGPMDEKQGGADAGGGSRHEYARSEDAVWYGWKLIVIQHVCKIQTQLDLAKGSVFS